MSNNRVEVVANICASVLVLAVTALGFSMAAVAVLLVVAAENEAGAVLSAVAAMVSAGCFIVLGLAFRGHLSPRGEQ